ncbi:MAG: lysostaphin resistance A-like protein [Bacteroidota bacterium]
MTLRAALADRTPYRKFLIIVGLILIGTVLFSALGGLLSEALFGIGLTELQGDFSTDSAGSGLKNAVRLIQTLSLLGSFLVPALLSAWLFSEDNRTFLGIETLPRLSQMLLVPVLFLCAVPFINWMMSINHGIHLPDSLKAVEDWMRTTEESAARLTELLVSGTSASDLVLNLFVIAVIPGIAEEFLFRGVLQRQFALLSGNRHAGIWLTAFLFSALHMQFLGFIPRFFLGALLGYLYAWSGSLWLSVFAHFCNNAFAVILTWAFAAGYIQLNPDTWGAEPQDAASLGVSVFLILSGIALIFRSTKRIQQH